MESHLQSGFTLGEFQVRPLEGLLEGPYGGHHLQPKVVDVLLCLAKSAGDVVEHRTILEEVWGSAEASQDALTHAISELRAGLVDQADNPKYIQTIPKRGYRLIVDVKTDHAESGEKKNPGSKNAMEALWGELRERNVVRVALAYAAVSWLLLQFAQIVFDALRLPDWVLPAFLFLLAVGFLVAVVVAWLYQVVPEKRIYEPGRSGRLKIAVDIGIIGVLTVAVGLLAYRQFVDAPPFPGVSALPAELTAPEPADKSVAVLRFANFGANSAFSNGLGEHLLNLLARIGDLEVPSRQVTWMLSDQNVDPRTIARVLRVRYLLEGSVQQNNESIRVTAQLIDGTSGNHIWSQHYDEELSADNFFMIQDSIAQQVVERLEATVSEKMVSQLKDRGTENDEALQHYLAGREALNEPKTEESLTSAVAAFEAAIELDPHFAEANAGLCEAHLAWYVTYRDVDYFDAGEAACIRALRIDSELGEVYAALGSLHRYGGQYDKAEDELVQARLLLNDPALVLEELGRTYRAQNKLVLAEQTFNEAIVKDPANWSVYKSMGNFLFRTGRYEAALPYYKQVTVMQRDSAVAFSNIGSAFFMLGDFENSSIAWQHSMDLEPTHFAFMNVGNSLYYQGEFEESVKMYREAIELGANDARAWGSLAASCLQVPGEEQCATDAYARAIDLINDDLAVNPFDAFSVARLAAFFAITGQHDEARSAIQRRNEINWDDPDVPFFTALAFISLDEPQNALSELKQAVLMGYPRVLLAADPGFESLHEDPEFIQLSNIGLH